MGQTKQIELSQPGANPVLKLREVSAPQLLDTDHVIIDVAYSGLNFADVMMTLDLYPDAPKPPFVPGYELSGTVKEVGKDVHDLKVGDRVIAGCRFGGYADCVSLPRWQVRKTSKGLQEGAASVVSFLTADIALNQQCRIRPHDTVMIDCGSGSLGVFLIGICQRVGVKEVIGLTSKEAKKEVITTRGAKAMTLEEWNKSDKKVDVIINTRGGGTLKENRKRLNPLGRMIGLGASHMTAGKKRSLLKIAKEFLSFGLIHPISLMNENIQVGGLNVLKLFDSPEVLLESFAAMEEFQITPIIDQVFEASDISKAIAYLGEGRSQGKVLLKWRSDVL